ncbi:MAG TPA: hypothetical protein VGU45_07155 [Microvirga sp.]|nr:hypothetical protein [Microvirga sp.]
MITALIRAETSVEALAVTLGALIPGVVDGLIGDAVVLARRPDEALARVADTVGATLLPVDGDPWITGAQDAKRDWLLCLDDGDVPVEGWTRAIDRFIALSPPDRRFGRLGRPRAPWLRRLSDLGPVRLRSGDLVHRSLLARPGIRLPRPVRVQASVERDPVFD